MKKQKRNIELIANNTDGALEMKKALSERGYEVNHIYTGCSTPILIENSNYTVGSGHIRAMYGLFKS
jgi:hypothetical protein